MDNNKQSKDKIKSIIRSRIPQSNITVAKILLIFAVVSLIGWVLFRFGVIEYKGVFIKHCLMFTSITFSITAVFCLLRKGIGSAFQYLFLFQLALFWLELDIMSGFKSKLLLTILIVLSLRYYNRNFTLVTYFVCITFLFLSVYTNAHLYRQIGYIDLNLVYLDGNYTVTLNEFISDEIIKLNPSTLSLLKSGLVITFLPNVIYLTAISFLAIRFMKYNLINIVYSKELSEREANQRAELSEMKTKIVLSQVKPHFIYNVLSSIAVLCKKDPTKAKNLTLKFSDYLRNNLDSLDSKSSSVCSFEAELDHIKNYLDIEKVRFEDKLTVKYEIGATDFTVPTLSIQPIVENAVKHGICEKDEGGTVTIKTEKTDIGWTVKVSDDGAGFNREDVKNDGKVHVGIENIKKRIALYGGIVSIESEKGVGTTVTVFIPIK